MAKGKKSKGKNYQSKGIHCQDKSLYKAIRRERSAIEIGVNLVEEWRKGHNPWVVVDNPNKNATRERQIRVRANDYYGDWKARYTMKQEKVDA